MLLKVLTGLLSKELVLKLFALGVKVLVESTKTKTDDKMLSIVTEVIHNESKED